MASVLRVVSVSGLNTHAQKSSLSMSSSWRARRLALLLPPLFLPPGVKSVIFCCWFFFFPPVLPEVEPLAIQSPPLPRPEGVPFDLDRLLSEEDDDDELEELEEWLFHTLRTLLRLRFCLVEVEPGADDRSRFASRVLSTFGRPPPPPPPPPPPLLFDRRSEERSASFS